MKKENERPTPAKPKLAKMGDPPTACKKQNGKQYATPRVKVLQPADCEDVWKIQKPQVQNRHPGHLAGMYSSPPSASISKGVSKIIVVLL
jgi:hypothetical protein